MEPERNMEILKTRPGRTGVTTILVCRFGITQVSSVDSLQATNDWMLLGHPWTTGLPQEKEIPMFQYAPWSHSVFFHTRLGDSYDYRNSFYALDYVSDTWCRQGFCQHREVKASWTTQEMYKRVHWRGDFIYWGESIKWHNTSCLKKTLSVQPPASLSWVGMRITQIFHGWIISGWYERIIDYSMCGDSHKGSHGPSARNHLIS